MKKQISILGCGWLGKAVAINFIKKGYSVKGSTTSVENLETLNQLGIKPYLIHISNKEQNWSEFLDSDILIIAITSKEKEAYLDLIAKIKITTLKHIIFISSTSVYPNSNGVVTENTSLKNTILTEIEAMFRAKSYLNTTILRFAGLFGYDRQPGNFFKQGKVIPNPEGFVNFIHRDDCVRIIEQIIVQNCWNDTFNACSNSHPSRREFYTTAFLKVGRSTPIFNEELTSEFKIVNSDKLKHTLDYTFIVDELSNY